MAAATGISSRLFARGTRAKPCPHSHPFAQRHAKARPEQLPKFYILDMFPYPSGAGLHVGHPEGYTATDILARYRRARGYNVLHPMGWDAFGLPAEQYAIKTGQHPRETTEQNIANFKRQIKTLGFSYDWTPRSRHHRPGVFPVDAVDLPPALQLVVQSRRRTRPSRSRRCPTRPSCRAGHALACRFDRRAARELERKRRAYRDSKRLAYVTEAPVWWCEQLGTVLANEEVVDGKSEVGGFPVVRKPMRQWMLRITAYAERLLAGPRHHRLERFAQGNAAQLDWAQRRGGGGLCDCGVARVRSCGVATSASASSPPGPTRCSARPTWCSRRSTSWWTKSPPPDAARGGRRPTRAEVAKKSDLERTELAKEKTGVFTGAYAINPVNGEKIPIWIADYVLISYGTGAIMAVPAHDTRDFEFATKFNLPIVQVVEPPAGTDWHGLRRRRRLGQLRRPRDFDHRPAHARGQAQDHRLAGGQGARQEDHQLQAARLALQPPALLGRAVPDRLEDRRRMASPTTRPCPNPRCRCCRRRWTTTSPRPTASRRSPAPRTG